jgi:hypothetical protein
VSVRYNEARLIKGDYMFAEILVGLFAVFAGAMFGYTGNVVMRLLFPFIGFFMGFSGGAAFVASFTSEGFLSTTLGWVIGFFAGMFFGLLAYAGFGFALASGLLSMLNMDWNWLVVILGSGLGLAFGISALLFRVPVLVLIIVTAFLGSAIFLYGLMLIFQTAELGDFSNGMAWESIRGSAGLYLLWLIMGVMGTVGQTKLLTKEAEFSKAYWNKSQGFDTYFKTT